MIKINLLPLEKRRPERTPFPRFMLILATAAVAAGILVVVGWTYIQIKAAQEEKQNLQSELDTLDIAVRNHSRLTKRINALKARISQIEMVTSRNVELWKTVDAVWNIVDENKKVWLDSIRLMDAKETKPIFRRTNPKAKSFPQYGLALECHAAGANARDLTRFRMGLKRHPYLMKKFPQMNITPAWSVESEEDFQGSYSMNFKVQMFPRMAMQTTAARRKSVGPKRGAR